MEKRMHNPFLIGNRVYLRPVEIADAPIIQKWHNDPELRQLGSGSGHATSRNKEEEDIKSAAHSQDEGYFMVVKIMSNEAVGFIRVNCLTSSSRNVWLRMIIGDKKSWGKNYAHDAVMTFLNWLFNELNMHRVTCETYATNGRAIRFFEKIGFKREGTIREAHFTDGKYYNIISFGLLKREFVKTKK